MLTVSEAALHAAQAELTEALGITVEGAAAASWAGLLAGPRPDRAGPRHRHRQQRLTAPMRRRGRRDRRRAATSRPTRPTSPRSAVPLGLLALAAAAFPAVRITVLIVLAAGAGVADRRAMRRCAGPGRAPCPWPSACSGAGARARGQRSTRPTAPNPASPLATWRAIEALVVLAALAVLAVVLKASPASLSLRWPARRWVRWAVLGFVVAGPLALLAGPYLAQPFFGDVGYRSSLGALVPALVFAVANGVMEEVIYRGALLGWSARVIGLGPAIVGQAIVFGVAHSGIGRHRAAGAADARAGGRRPAGRRHRRPDPLAAHPDRGPHRARHPDLLRVRLPTIAYRVIARRRYRCDIIPVSGRSSSSGHGRREPHR